MPGKSESPACCPCNYCLQPRHASAFGAGYCEDDLTTATCHIDVSQAASIVFLSPSVSVDHDVFAMAVTPRDVASTNELNEPEKIRLLDLLCSAKNCVVCDEGDHGRTFTHAMVPVNSRSGLAKRFFFRIVDECHDAILITTED